MDLFETLSDKKTEPLAERLRPKSLNEFVGQLKEVGPKSHLYRLLERGELPPNLILWGPPGTGKTTFARLLSHAVKANFLSVNAVDTGAKELRSIGMGARHSRLQTGDRTILFIDEIHRLNKAQQDVLLPFTEKGDFILVGATTENPGYELNSAVLSRCRVLVFERLSEEELRLILNRAALDSDVELPLIFEDEAIEELLGFSNGDARKLLNSFESIVKDYLPFKEKNKSYQKLNKQTLAELLSRQPLRYDKKGDEHYDTISAFIKSVRGSDPNAAIYYLARMLEAGEDPVFLARRLVILASEDIGNADPRALSLAVAGLQSVELVGMPEARISLAQVTTYLASAPKSNRSYMAINKAMELVNKMGNLPIPLHLRSAQTRFAKDQGYGKDYKYSHDFARGYAEQSFLPKEIIDEKLYEPSEHGFEKNIKQYLDWLHGKPTNKDI